MRHSFRIGYGQPRSQSSKQTYLHCVGQFVEHIKNQLLVYHSLFPPPNLQLLFRQHYII
uniref:Uncharacterized protein n=1 Tax=Siphoviridae sp. ctPyh10 TaxID=2827865 RepID=A0A8S5SYU6_9CAUD|nr:MAG TPA: hypothetical protein [Caudoviricetes sp.]DAF56292.1 MAG TPA: hypothetical protein [Siphoviridae sp. ctPyh10]